MQISIKNLSEPFAKVSVLLKSDLSLDQIAPQVLEELCHTLNCQWGTYWKVFPEVHQLRPFATWTEANFSAPTLSRDTKNRTLSISEGTAGHVWRSKKPVWTLDLIKDMCLPRSLDAASSGLTGGIWFALKDENTVFGVIELLGQSIASPSDELILRIESFGMVLGHLLEQRSARDLIADQSSITGGSNKLNSNIT